MRFLYVLIKKNPDPKQRKMMDVYFVDESMINDYRSAHFTTCTNDAIPKEVIDRINEVKTRYNAVMIVIDEKLKTRVALANMIHDGCGLKARFIRVGDHDVTEEEIIEQVKNNQHVEVNNATTSNTVYIQQLLDPFFNGKNEVSPKNIFYMLSSQFYSNGFGYYVKREVSRRLGCSFANDDECAEALCKCYEEKGLLLPPFERGKSAVFIEPTENKIKNLFNRQTGTREIVISIAYALEFDVDTVNDFLARHLQKYVLDDRNPIDVIHKYCFTFDLDYSKAMELIGKLDEIEYDSKNYYALESILTDKELPMEVRETYLLNYAKSVSTEEAKKKRIEILSSVLTERLNELDEIFEDLKETSSFVDDEDDGTAAISKDYTVVGTMSRRIPKDFKKVNLLSSSKSVLNKIFNEFQINSQRFAEIKNGIGMCVEPVRMGTKANTDKKKTTKTIDEFPNVRNWIIAINFLINVFDYKDELDLVGFQNKVNEDLINCGYGPLHNTNAFDCYIMLAVCSPDPLEVIERINVYSYRVETEETEVNPMATLVRRAKIKNEGKESDENTCKRKRKDVSKAKQIEAQYQLGLEYEKGERLKRNLKVAFKWIKRAAEQGHPDAQFVLSRFYSEGVGVEANEEEAKHWLISSAESGCIEAKEALQK